MKKQTLIRIESQIEMNVLFSIGWIYIYLEKRNYKENRKKDEMHFAKSIFSYTRLKTGYLLALHY